MPKITDKNIISDQTRKCTIRLIFLSTIIIIFNLYNVPFESFAIFGVNIPEEIIDIVFLLTLIYFSYTFIIDWIGDVQSYRLWFQDNSILSEFSTKMKLDKTFLSGGVNLLEKLYTLEEEEKLNKTSGEVSQELKDEFNSFKTNIELYIVRLEATHANFKKLNSYVKYYIFIENFTFPILMILFALIVLIKYGKFNLP